MRSIAEISKEERRRSANSESMKMSKKVNLFLFRKNRAIVQT